MRPRLLFIYIQPSSFVREDLRILGETYELVPFRFGGDAKPGPVAFGALLVKQLLWLLRELPRADAIFGWFADYHMLLPALAARALHKPVVVALGGFDAISLPSLEYGVVRSAWRWPVARMVLRCASMLLPVSPSLVYSKNRFSEWPAETEQGIQAFVPDLDTPIRVVPTGYDPDAWPMGPLDRDPIVATAGMIDSHRTLIRKGIDLLFETARRMPGVRFRVIGVLDRPSVNDRYDPPPNVELIGPVPREALVAHYHDASVYLQLSRAEGLPNVLCEAMLCGCVPVGSRAFGIPDGVGDVGYVVEEPDPDAIETAIRRALSTDAARRRAARGHIEAHFHVDRRRSALLSIMSDEIERRPGTA